MTKQKLNRPRKRTVEMQGLPEREAAWGCNSSIFLGETLKTMNIWWRARAKEERLGARRKEKSRINSRKQIRLLSRTKSHSSCAVCLWFANSTWELLYMKLHSWCPHCSVGQSPSNGPHGNESEDLSKSSPSDWCSVFWPFSWGWQSG